MLPLARLRLRASKRTPWISLRLARGTVATACDRAGLSILRDFSERQTLDRVRSRLVPADQRGNVVELGLQGDDAGCDGFHRFVELFHVAFEAGDATLQFDRLRKI